MLDVTLSVAVSFSCAVAGMVQHKISKHKYSDKFLIVPNYLLCCKYSESYDDNRKKEEAVSNFL